MPEADAIRSSPSPRTREGLAQDLNRLGLSPGDTVLIHSSLSSLGWVCGGPVAVMQALVDVVTRSGTLVMPAHSNALSDPAEWEHPPVPEDWWETIRKSMPAYDARLTPTLGMGVIAETFRSRPDTLRSAHPQYSFAAWGRNAGFVTADHALDHALGETSPLARLYDLDAKVLLLGTGHDSNTSFHLAEYRMPGSRPTTPGAPILEDGYRVWRTFKDIDLHEETFPEIGAAFEEDGHAKVGEVGSAEARLFPQRAAVDFAQSWLTRRRADA